MINKNAISQTLRMESDIKTEPKEMAAEVQLTTFPFDPEQKSELLVDFYKELRSELEACGVNFIPFEDSLEKLSLWVVFKRFIWMLTNDFSYLAQSILSKEPTNTWLGYKAFQNLFKRSRIKPGISVIAIGGNKEGRLPMDYTDSFKKTSVITLMQMPNNISRDSDFEDHFTTALDLFAHHMTNIVIGVSEENWLLYNFNASHPFFSRDENFRNHILSALIPKLHAPIKPPKLQNFTVKEGAFKAQDADHKKLVNDMLTGGKLLGKTNLYPSGRLLEDLPFRNSFYEWIGQLHIDKRNGMSFGFLARQMPTEIPNVEVVDKNDIPDDAVASGFYQNNGNTIWLLEINNKTVSIQVPSVWVLTQRSGSDKTNMHPVKDLVKLGLTDEGLQLHTPEGIQVEPGYRPSFDTRVILAHALGNSIAAGLFDKFSVNDNFVERFCNNGMALAHWHGYMRPDKIPNHIRSHGVKNPHVACSSPQSAIYALQGKIRKIKESIETNQSFDGDVHIEPHHGINVSWYSLKKLGKFLNDNSNASKLGNEYLKIIRSQHE